MALPSLRDALGEARWFDGNRARAYRLAMLAVTLLVATGWIATSRHGIDARGKPLGTDFLAFWSASRMALSDHAHSVYDLASIYAAERAAMPVDPGPSSFLYPPPFLLLCLPLGLAPYFVSLVLWLTATGVAYAAAMRRWLGEHPRDWMTILAFPAVVTNIGHGQNGFLTAALLGGGLWLLDRRPWTTGLLLGCLVMKPQLALAVPILVLASGRWRVMLGGIASALILCGFATAAFGWGIWPAFLAGGATGRAILDQGLVEPGKMVSVFAAVRVLHGGAPAGYALQALATLAAAAMLALVCRRRDIVPGGKAALCAAATVVMSPFLLDYDLTVIAIPLAWLFGEGLRRGFRPGEKLVLAAAYALPLYGRDLALGLGLPVAPLILGALLGMTARAALPFVPSAVEGPAAHAAA